MNNRLALAALTTLGLFAASRSIGATEKLMLRVTPNVSSAPSTVIVMATVPKNPDNRSLHIEAESAVFYRSSEVQLDGDKAPLITEIRLSNLPSGEYTVMAKLRETTGAETIVRRTALVLPRRGEP
jgi:hypothetical protein